jgi:cyclin A
LQVGIASLVIANKYEEVYGPCLREFETVSAGTYTRVDILKMERIILRTLDFGLTVPTTFTFMRRFVKASEYGKFPEFNNLAQYLCEWSLLSNTCLQWAPSLIAASSVYASFKAFSLKRAFFCMLVNRPDFASLQVTMCFLVPTTVI